MHLRKKMKLVILILLLSIFLFDCSEKKPASTKEFDLVYIGDIDKFELQRGTLERKYMNGVKVFEVKLSEDQKASLQDFIVRNDINSIQQQNLLTDCDIYTIPEFKQKMLIKIANNPVVNLEWTTNNCGEGINDLDRLIEILYSMINDSTRQIERTDITFE
jgi:hypothetical protein